MTHPPDPLGVVAANGRAVADCNVEPETLEGAREDAANAALIEQAPAMLAALQRLVKLWNWKRLVDEGDAVDLVGPFDQEELERVAQIIARATGRS